MAGTTSEVSRQSRSALPDLQCQQQTVLLIAGALSVAFPSCHSTTATCDVRVLRPPAQGELRPAHTRAPRRAANCRRSGRHRAPPPAPPPAGQRQRRPSSETVVHPRASATQQGGEWRNRQQSDGRQAKSRVAAHRAGRPSALEDDDSSHPTATASREHGKGKRGERRARMPTSGRRKPELSPTARRQGTVSAVRTLPVKPPRQNRAADIRPHAESHENEQEPPPTGRRCRARPARAATRKALAAPSSAMALIRSSVFMADRLEMPWRAT